MNEQKRSMLLMTMVVLIKTFQLVIILLLAFSIGCISIIMYLCLVLENWSGWHVFLGVHPVLFVCSAHCVLLSRAP